MIRWESCPALQPHHAQRTRTTDGWYMVSPSTKNRVYFVVTQPNGRTVRQTFSSLREGKDFVEKELSK